MLECPESATYPEVRQELDKLACHFAHYAGEPGSQRYDGLMSYRKKLEARLAWFESRSYDNLYSRLERLENIIASNPSYKIEHVEALKESQLVRKQLQEMAGKFSEGKV